MAHELTRTGAPAILLSIVRDLVLRKGLRPLIVALRSGELLEDFLEWAPVLDMELVRQSRIPEAGFLELLVDSLALSARRQCWSTRLVGM